MNSRTTYKWSERHDDYAFCNEIDKHAELVTPEFGMWVRTPDGYGIVHQVWENEQYGVCIFDPRMNALHRKIEILLPDEIKAAKKELGLREDIYG